MGLAVATVFAAGAGAAATPRFTAPVVSSVGSTKWEASEVLAADLNGDGKPDLVTASPGSSRLLVAVGKGDGSFHRPVAYRFDSPGRLPYDVAVGDLNGDGRPELTVVGATFRRTVIIVLINDGGGRFHRDRVYASAAIKGADLIAVGDVDGNGIVDVVVAGMPRGRTDLAVLLGTGGGQLATPRRATGRGEWSDLAVGDFNSDGRLDAVLAAYTGDHAVSVRLGAGDGTFGPARRFGAAPLGAEAVTSADLNHDGILDLAVALDLGRRVGVLLGNGDGTFAAQREYAMRSGSANDVLIADFDGDGNPDIATSNYTSAPFIVRLGRGDGTFQRRHVLRSFHAYSDALQDVVRQGAVADFNLDGRSDIAVATGHADFFISDLSVLLNWTGLPAPPCVVVPIAREPVRRAKRHLENAGCRVRLVRFEHSRRVRKGRVISQRPRHGAVLVTGAGVDLVVSRG